VFSVGSMALSEKCKRNEGIRIENQNIKGVTSQIEFAPLLVLSHHLNQNLHPECQGGGRKCGSDGGRSIGCDMHQAA
jgi:hypothetical protein